MEGQDKHMRDYRDMLMTRHAAEQLGITGMEPWPPQRAARLMAIVTEYGNNENFTNSPKFREDRKYIQEIYGIDGGEKPDATFAEALRKEMALCQAVQSDTDPHFIACAKFIKDLYGFKILF